MQDDLISRQAAIENSFEVYTKEYGWCEVVGVDAISELPSAQPEHPDITLESAIDYLHSIGWMQEHDRILTESAQPELRWIPCGKCIHADGKHRWCKVLDRTINEDYFCYWAEPWKEGEADES